MKGRFFVFRLKCLNGKIDMWKKSGLSHHTHKIGFGILYIYPNVSRKMHRSKGVIGTRLEPDK